MDNITHTLTGLAMSQAGLNRRTRFATLALLIGANLPDIDLVTRLKGSATYLEYHRGLTHSFFGVITLGALLAATIYYFGRRASPPKPGGPSLNGRWLLATCWIATGSHLLMDFTNAYGVRPLLPWSGKWYAWDIMPIIDPLLLLLLVAGLGLPVIFRLVSEELGARKPGFNRGAILALVAMLLLWGLRDLSHRRVLAFLSSHAYGQEVSLRLGAFPRLDPFAWTGVVETDSAFHVLAANALDSDVNAEDTEIFRKPDPSPALDAALKTRTGRIFSHFARFLWPQVAEDQDGFQVRLQDLRFMSPISPRHGFVAEIQMDKNLRVTSESFSFLGKSSDP